MREDLERVELIDRGVAVNFPVKAGLGVRADDDGFDADLVADFLLPLVAEMRQADDGEAVDVPAFEQFANDQQGLDGFADANVIRDEQADRFLSQRHDQWHHLIAARAERNLARSGKGRHRCETLAGRHHRESGRGRNRRDLPGRDAEIPHHGIDPQLPPREEKSPLPLRRLRRGA